MVVPPGRAEKSEASRWELRSQLANVAYGVRLFFKTYELIGTGGLKYVVRIQNT